MVVSCTITIGFLYMIYTFCKMFSSIRSLHNYEYRRIRNFLIVQLILTFFCIEELTRNWITVFLQTKDEDWQDTFKIQGCGEENWQTVLITMNTIFTRYLLLVPFLISLIMVRFKSSQDIL